MSSLNIMKGIIKKNPSKLKGRSTSYSKDEISPLIKPGDEWEIKDEIDIEPPYSRVVIFFNQKTGEYLYHVNEPIIPDNLKNFIKSVKDNIIEDIDSNPDKREERIEILRKKIDEFAIEREINLSGLERERVFYYVYRDFEGYGSIQVPMLDPNVEDISCDGTDIPIHIFHRRLGSIRSNIIYKDDAELDTFILWIVQRSGNHISVASPMADCTLPDGSRLQATLGREVTKRGSSFTIRRFKENPFTPLDLLKMKTLNKDILVYIWLAVENGMSIFVVGGTASGKTTTLNSILLFIPPGKKIVSIEDTREINIPHENWIPSVTRPGIGEVNPITNKKMGEVDMFDLLVASLRQRPNYIIVGEVRGVEAYNVFQAMATGHTAYSTFHADDVRTLVHRLESTPINLPKALISSLDIVLMQGQVKVDNKLSRRVKQMVEIVGVDPGSNELTTNNAYEWDPVGDVFNFSGHSYIIERILTMRNWSMRRMEIEIERRKKILDYMNAVGIDNYRDFASLVSYYFKKPDGLLDRVRQTLGEEIS